MKSQIPWAKRPSIAYWKLRISVSPLFNPRFGAPFDTDPISTVAASGQMGKSKQIAGTDSLGRGYCACLGRFGWRIEIDRSHVEAPVKSSHRGALLFGLVCLRSIILLFACLKLAKTP